MPLLDKLGAAIGAYLYLSAGIGEVALGGGFVALRPLQILGSGPLLGLVGTVEGLYFVLDFEFEGQPFVFQVADFAHRCKPFLILGGIGFRCVVNLFLDLCECLLFLAEFFFESRQQEITENFNRRNAADLEENNRRGKENKLRMEEVNQYISEIEEKIAEQVSIISEIEMSGILTAKLIEPDANPTIAANTEYIALGEQIAELEKEVSQPIAATEDDFLREGRDSLTVGIDALKSRLMKREQIEKNNQRIAELEKSLRMQSEELAQLEGIEFTMAAFSKARTEAIESKINGLFDFVKFRLFETQINGGEVETCEAMVNGVPFSDANTAGQFNAGIDIINAICRFEGISAPIFADGSESVNTLHPTQSQVIRLFVSLDDKLVIKHNGNPAQPKSLFD